MRIDQMWSCSHPGSPVISGLLLFAAHSWQHLFLFFYNSPCKAGENTGPLNVNKKTHKADESEKRLYPKLRKWEERCGSDLTDLGFWKLIQASVDERRSAMDPHERRVRREGRTRIRRRYVSHREWVTCRCWRTGIVGRSPCASVCRSVAGRLQTRATSGPASFCWSPLEPGHPNLPAERRQHEHVKPVCIQDGWPITPDSTST